MSMWINLARVTPEAFELIKGDPELLGPLFMEQDTDVLGKLGVATEDISGLDYDSASQMIDAMADVDEDAIEIDGEPAGDAADADAAEDAADDDDDADTEENDEDGDTEQVAGDAASEDDEDADVVLVDLCIDGTLPYDAGFGSAFFLSPAAAKQAAESSAALGLDDEAKAVVQAAGERGHYVVGVIS